MANPNPPAPPDNTNKTYKTRKESGRVQVFKMFYLDPTSTTFWNVRGSALRAGYSELYANNITVQEPKWWNELQASAEFDRAEMLSLAQKNMHKRLKTAPSSPLQEKLQADTDKFISERLGKEHYSTRQEVTGADGRRLFTNEKRVDATIPLTNLFKGVSASK